MPLPITKIFRPVRPDDLIEADTHQARIELLSAEKRLENEQATVDMYRKRIARLTTTVNSELFITTT